MRVVVLLLSWVGAGTALVRQVGPRSCRSCGSSLQGSESSREDVALWEERADGLMSDVDLEGLDDVDSLYDAKRRCGAAVARAAAAGVPPRELCVASSNEAVALLAYAQGCRRFAVPSVLAAAALADALPKDARYLSRGAPRLPRDRVASSALGGKLVFQGARPPDTGGQEPPRQRGARTKVSASRKRFLEKRDAERATADADRPRSKKPTTRTLASAPALLAALDSGDALDDDLGGVVATSDDAPAALDAARRFAARRPRDTVAVALPLSELDALTKDERTTFDVWPILALDDPANDPFLGDDDDDLDAEFDDIKLPAPRP